MKRFFNAFIAKTLTYFDPDERRLVAQAVVIGVVVWMVVFFLQNAVHKLSHTTLHFLSELPPLYVAPAVLASLATGALLLATLAYFTGTYIHYRDSQGHIHQLLDIEGDGLERAISLYHASEPIFEQTLLGREGVDVRWEMPTFSLAIRKFLATLITLGSGGSGGLEASVSLIGEATAAGLFKPRHTIHHGRWQSFWQWWLSDDPDDLQTAQLSGISAAVATLINAPFTAAFFATEVMYRRRPIVEKLVYSLISALVAFFLNNIATTFLSAPQITRFEIKHLFEYNSLYVPPLGDLRYYLVLVLMSVAIALFSVQFGQLRRFLDEYFHHRWPNIWLRHLLGAILTGFVAVIAWGAVVLASYYHWFGLEEKHTHDIFFLVLGVGEDGINQALAGELILAVAIVALIAKMWASLFTISSGGSAGLLIPSLFFGTMIATIFAQLPAVFGLDLPFVPFHFIVPAMTASLVSIVNVPLAATLFAVEVFSGSYMVPSLITLVVAAIVTHQTSIYRTQREIYHERQILPGYSVRRIAVPLNWRGQTLVALDIRRRYQLNVIGWVNLNTRSGSAEIELSAEANRPLAEGDILVVLGRDEDLAHFAQLVQEENKPRPEPTEPNPAG